MQIITKIAVYSVLMNVNTNTNINNCIESAMSMLYSHVKTAKSINIDDKIVLVSCM